MRGYRGLAPSRNIGCAEVLPVSSMRRINGPGGGHRPVHRLIPVEKVSEGVRKAPEVRQIGVVISRRSDKHHGTEQRRSVGCGGLIGVIGREELGAIFADSSRPVNDVARNENEVRLGEICLVRNGVLGRRPLAAISKERQTEGLAGGLAGVRHSIEYRLAGL